MKKILLLSSLLLSCACSDQNELFQNVQEDITNEGVVMTVPGFIWDEALGTRTTLTPTSSGMSFAWKTGDQVGIYTESTSMANFDIDQISQDAKSATFDGGGFSLTEGSTYYAFYPYDTKETNKSQILINYQGQNQLANGSTEHLSAYDFMVAKAVADSHNSAAFNFEHLGAIVKLNITVPENRVFTNVFFSSSNPITLCGTVNITEQNPSIEMYFASNCSFLLNNIPSSDYKLTAYFMMPPCNLSGDIVKISLLDNEGNYYEGTTTGKDMVAGKAYAYNINVRQYIDLCLPSGKKWSADNLGAGSYYAWGETETKSYYLSTNYSSSYSSPLSLNNDVAQARWGGNWRIPSRAEWEELIENCNWEYIYKSPYYYFKGTSKINSRTIFIKLSGWKDGSVGSTVDEDGNPETYFWCRDEYNSTLGNAAKFYIHFDEDGQLIDYRCGIYHLEKYEGCSIRAILY